MHVGRMATANAPIAQWDDLLKEGFLSYWKGHTILWALHKGKLMFKIVISMKNEYRTKPKKY